MVGVGRGRAAGRGSRAACLHTCIRACSESCSPREGLGGETSPHPAPAVLPVCSEVGLWGWGALAALGGEIWGPSRSCPACPELVSRVLLATGWPIRSGAVVRLPGNRKGQRCPQPVQGPRPCLAPLCVFHNSPLIFLTFPGHPRSSCGLDGSLSGCWLSPPTRWALAAQTRV